MEVEAYVVQAHNKGDDQKRKDGEFDMKNFRGKECKENNARNSQPAELDEDLHTPDKSYFVRRIF